MILQDDLIQLRLKIDEVDARLIQDLAERLELVKLVGQLKKKMEMTALQPQRWQIVLEKNIAQGQKKNLGVEFVTDIWERIHREALEIETQEIEKMSHD